MADPGEGPGGPGCCLVVLCFMLDFSKNECLRGYDRLCLQEWHNMPLAVLIYF